MKDNTVTENIVKINDVILTVAAQKELACLQENNNDLAIHYANSLCKLIAFLTMNRGNFLQQEKLDKYLPMLACISDTLENFQKP